MAEKFQAKGLPLLIGSLPMGNHEDAAKLVFRYCPEIPLWVQLPAYKEEGMIFQFLPGFPGLSYKEDRAFIDTENASFPDDLLGFYEDYMADTEGKTESRNSRFALKPDTARGFFSLTDALKKCSEPPLAIKGQITGPITFATAVKNQNRRAIFYDEQLRDVAVKLIARKAGWQVRQLSRFGSPVIVFFDEPSLAGFGSSEFISISYQEVSDCFEEVMAAVHSEGGLAGIHVCANADWSLILNSSADIVSFDAYSYFDKFILYAREIKKFIESGHIIAWGIVPTSQPADIERETADSLVERWSDCAEKIRGLGIDPTIILTHSFITPSCGTGSLSLEHATRVLKLTREVSDRLRARMKIR